MRVLKEVLRTFAGLENIRIRMIAQRNLEIII